MLTWQCVGPAAHIGAADNDDGVLANGLEHDDGMSGRSGGNDGEVVEAYSAVTECVGDEVSVGIAAYLADEVGGVGELGAARSLVGALPAGEGLAAFCGDRFAFPREPVDLHVDVGVGGPHHHNGRWWGPRR